MSEERSIWVWVINRADRPGDIFGAMRRCERAHWTDDSARAEVIRLANEMRIGRIKWDEVDNRTWVGRTDLGYTVVVTSVLLPHGPP
jgi:hypothetical protein